jgi:hypothetical protein
VTSIRALVVLCLLLPLAAQAQETKTFSLALADGRLSNAPDTIRVQQGEAVELRWTSDRPMAIELHGYEIKTQVSPQVPAMMSFRANIAGRFQVHAEGSGQGHATILYVEVYPK